MAFWMFILGESLPDDMFVPIGNYYVLEKDTFSLLDIENLSTQVVDLVLKEPLRGIKSVQDIRDGHAMLGYLDALSKDAEAAGQSRVIPKSDEMNPKIEEHPRMLWEKQDDGYYECKLVIRGTFISPLLMQSEQNDFADSPFTSTSPWKKVRANQ